MSQNLPNLDETPGIRRTSSAVRKARAKLQADAEDILADFRQMIQYAAAQGEYEAALKAQQWLVDHIQDEDGLQLIGPSADKPKQVIEAPKGPLIQIGIIQAGVGKDKPALPEITVEAETIDE